MEYPEIPLCIHQDHGDRVATCIPPSRTAFTSVMMDGSLKEDGKTPADYDYNVAITAEVARLAHMVGASVEGELGCLGSLETGHGEAEDGHGFEGKLDRDQPADRSRRGHALSSPTPRWTLWPWRLAPRMAPINSRASRPATCWRWT